MSESERRRRQGAEYESVGEEYLEHRQLQKGAAGWVLLAGLGGAYVISGEIGGWQFGVAGGEGGLALGARGGGGGWVAHRHDPHGHNVHRYGLLPGRTLGRYPGSRGRLRFRPAGHGGVGRVPHGHGDRDRGGDNPGCQRHTY